jgi:preprotein translocase subunit YajC
MMEFLYFPEDKSEYLPALISLSLFVLAAIITMYLLYKHSKKEEKRTNEQFSLSDKGKEKKQ